MPSKTMSTCALLAEEGLEVWIPGGVAEPPGAAGELVIPTAFADEMNRP